MENSSHTPANQAGRLGPIGVFSLHISLQQGFITTELTDHLTEHHSTDGCCIHSKKQQKKKPTSFFQSCIWKEREKNGFPNGTKGIHVYSYIFTRHVTNCQPQQPGWTAVRTQTVRIFRLCSCLITKTITKMFWHSKRTVKDFRNLTLRPHLRKKVSTTP